MLKLDEPVICIMKFLILFNREDLGFGSKISLQFLLIFCPLDLHIFADTDPDPGSQNFADPTDPDPKH